AKRSVPRRKSRNRTHLRRGTLRFAPATRPFRRIPFPNRRERRASNASTRGTWVPGAWGAGFSGIAGPLFRFGPCEMSFVRPPAGPVEQLAQRQGKAGQHVAAVERLVLGESDGSPGRGI